MAISTYSLTHRYTPPTCTLEIFAPSQRNQLYQEQFRLKFDDPRLSQEEQITIEGSRPLLETLYQTVSDYLSRWLSPRTLTLPLQLAVEAGDVQQCHLQTLDLLHHQLQLHYSNTNQTIPLSAAQLFDLANALDQYYLDTAAALTKSNRQTKSALTAAAAVAITVGIGSIIGVTTQPNQSVESSVDSAANSSPTTGDNSSQIMVSPPVVPESNQTPTPKPKIPETLTSSQKLPVPPPVDTPKPPPNIPDPAKITLNTPPVKPVVIPAPTPINPQPQSTPTETTIQPQPTTEQSSSSTTSIQTPDLPPPTTSTNNPESNQDSEQTTPVESDTVESDTDAPEKIDKTNENDIAAIAEPKPIQNLPQIAEVKQYFQQRWQPPETLDQSIQYRLQLNSDGSIGLVTPVGQTAAIYLDRSSIPLMGEPFVSPLETKNTATVRLVLNPDGSVQAFAE